MCVVTLQNLLTVICHTMLAYVHHHPELVSDVAISTSVCQAVLFCARRWAVASPRLSGCRLFSIVRNQVCLGWSGLRLQCFGRPVVLAYSAREWSWLSSALCRCDQRSEGVWSGLCQTVMAVGFMIGPRCWWCALSSVYSGCGVDTIDQEHRIFAAVAVTAQVSAPYRNISRMQEL